MEEGLRVDILRTRWFLVGKGSVMGIGGLVKSMVEGFLIGLEGMF